MLNVAGNNIHINVFQINGTMMITPIMSAKIIVRPQYRSNPATAAAMDYGKWMNDDRVPVLEELTNDHGTNQLDQVMYSDPATKRRPSN